MQSKGLMNRGYGTFQEEKNDGIDSNENDYLVVKFKLMFVTKKQ